MNVGREWTSTSGCGNSFCCAGVWLMAGTVWCCGATLEALMLDQSLWGCIFIAAGAKMRCPFPSPLLLLLVLFQQLLTSVTLWDFKHIRLLKWFYILYVNACWSDILLNSFALNASLCEVCWLPGSQHVPVSLTEGSTHSQSSSWSVAGCAWGHGLVVNLAVLREWLDSILKVFSNINDAMKAPASPHPCR